MAAKAAMREITSMGSFTAVISVATNVMNMLGIDGPLANVLVFTAAAIGNMVLEAKKSGGGQETLTVSKQFSKLGVNMGLWILGFLAYWLFVYLSGADSGAASSQEINSKLLSASSKNPLLNQVLKYLGNFVIYGFIRGVTNTLLMIPAIANLFM